MTRFLIVPFLILLGGCQFWIAGHSADMSAYVTGGGTADPLAGTTVFKFEIIDTGVICNGTSWPNSQRRSYQDPEAFTQITCNDGRTGKGESRMVTAETGASKGTDSCGNKFVFDFSANQFLIQEKQEEYRDKIKKSGDFWNDKCVASTDAPKHSDPLM